MKRSISKQFLADNDMDNYFLRSNLPRYEKTYSLIHPHLEKNKFLRILDLGTGLGYMAILTKKFFPQHNVVAGDIEITNNVRKRLIKAEIEIWPHSLKIEANRDLPIKSESFDVVYFFEILEHIIADPICIFSQINRILKVGGYLFLTTPNIASLYNRILLLLGKQPQLYISGLRKGFQEPRGHFREWTTSELLYLLKDIFEVQELRFLNCVGNQGLIRERKLFKILYYPHHFLCAIKPSFRSTIGIVCQKI